MSTENLKVPPNYCEYSDGPCDQDFSDLGVCDGFFLYPSNPTAIASTIESAVQILREKYPEKSWKLWKTLNIPGRVIFCEICKQARGSTCIIADVTTFNFNLLFEIGFSLGLGLPVIPIRDTTYELNKREFAELGVLDTLGYLDFTNSAELAKKLAEALPGSPFGIREETVSRESPLYVLKGPIETDGAVKLMSTLKKSGLKFRTYDHIETPRLSLFEATKQIAKSVGVIANLLSPNRRGAKVHNAMCALLCGVAMAQKKVVSMLQEETVSQPIDYRDVVQCYSTAENVPRLIQRPIRRVVQNIQLESVTKVKASDQLLEKLDLGDVAAENEIIGLRSYFVRTGQFTQAKQGHARLIVGRKGTGKTAMFYAVRDSLPRSHSWLILDLKPEGHQFTKLREIVLNELSPGLQEHTMAAFWNYILISELAHKILTRDISYAQRDPERAACYKRVKELYEAQELESYDDFSQRLLRQVDRLTRNVSDSYDLIARGRITELLYRGDLNVLQEAVSDYLKEKEAVWLLIDNLDKGWPTKGTTSADILTLRSLLEATRKIQRNIEGRGVEFKCLVFIRTDIYDHLVRETTDKGKDTFISIDWDDPEVFKKIVQKRIETSLEVNDSFSNLWPLVFESHIGAYDSFNYMIDRTLMRPRDLLLFIQRAIEVAVNRDHTSVTADDILQAERSYSEDLLLTTGFEIADTQPSFEDVIYAFQGSPEILAKQNVVRLLEQSGIPQSEIEKVIDLLLWFSFLGVTNGDASEPVIPTMFDTTYAILSTR